MSDIHITTYVCFCALLWFVYLAVWLAFAIRGKRESYMTISASFIIAVIVSAAVCIPLEQMQRKRGYERNAELQQAREEGYNAATQDIPPTACPYDKERKTHWMNGWQEGFKTKGTKK